MKQLRALLVAAAGIVVCAGLMGCPAPPTADFTASPTTGEAPLEVEFTDLSDRGSASIEMWRWDFGDGRLSSLRRPTHTYADPGLYQVSLTVTSSAGSDTEVKTDYIYVTKPPAAEFTATPTSGDMPLRVEFTDESTPGSSPITQWRWSFGDGSRSSAKNPSHTYTRPGIYAISLSVYSAEGNNTKTKVDYVTVIEPKDVLEVSNTQYDFALNDTPWHFQVWNGHPELMAEANFTITTNEVWLVCDPISGTSAGASDKVNVTVMVNRNGLSEGRHEGVITIAGEHIVPKTVDIQVTSEGGSAGGDGWTLSSVAAFYKAPYLVEFAFSLRDEDGRAIVAEPAQFEVSCEEDGLPISSETDAHLARGDSRQLLTCLVLDYTASMADTRINGDSDGDGVSDAIESMEEAAKSVFLDALDPDTQTAIYEFHRGDRDPEKVAEFTVDKDYLKERIDAIWVEYVRNFPAESRCWDALYAAAEEFGEEDTRDEQRAVIFLSDGLDESSNHTYQDVIDRAKAGQIAIYGIGFGAELDHTILQLITQQTNGRYYPADRAEDLALHFQRILEDLGGQYVLRWATLKRTDQQFVPSFTLTLSGHTLSYTAEKTYKPSDHAGDPLQGTLRFVPVQDGGNTSLLLRAGYVPRYITRLSLWVGSQYPFTVSLVDVGDGGLCASWVLTQEQDPETGLKHVYLESQTPDNIFSAIPYAAFGPILRFDFDQTVEDLSTIFDEASTIDNEIYLGGQSLDIDWVPGEPGKL